MNSYPPRREETSEEAAVLHYTYNRFGDLKSRRDRCDCAPTEDDAKRCFILPFDRWAGRGVLGRRWLGFQWVGSWWVGMGGVGTYEDGCSWRQVYRRGHWVDPLSATTSSLCKRESHWLGASFPSK